MLQKKMCVAIYHDFDCFCELSMFLAIICYPDPYHETDPDPGGRKETDPDPGMSKGNGSGSGGPKGNGSKHNTG